MKKRLTALLLTLVMVLSLFPTTVFATGRGTQIGGKETVLSWRANRRSSESGLQVTVTGSGLSGKELSVDVLKNAEAEQYISAIESAGNTLNNPMALDIKILDNGAEWQPAGKVQVTITRADTKLADKVYHFVKLTAIDAIGEDAEAADAAADEELTYEELISSTSGDTATVDTRHFSVYVVSETPADTYEFYLNATDTTPYAKQKVVANDWLYEPSTPTTSGAQKFLGWYIEGQDAPIAFNGEGKYVVTSVTGNATVKVYARFGEFYYATFRDQDGNIFSRLAVEAGKQLTADRVPDYTPKQSSQSLAGWSSVNNGDNTGNPANKVTFPVTPTADVEYWPIIETGYYVHFETNRIEGMERVSVPYTAPVFVRQGETATRPADPVPSVTTFVFGGWYTDAACTTPFNWNTVFGTGAGQQNDDITLYAKWTTKNANYTIEIWRQKVDDNKNATGDDRNWEYYESFSGSAAIGATIRYSDLARNIRNKTYTGFTYDSNNGPITVAADGSSVIKLYYRRNLMTINFYVVRYNNQWLYDYDAYDYSDYAQVWRTITGLYGSTFAQAAAYETEANKENYEWPSDYKWYTPDDGGYNQSLLTAFTTNVTPLRFYCYGGSAEGNAVYHVKQKADGSWPTLEEVNSGDAEFVNVAYTSGGSFTVSKKYDTFYPVAYTVGGYQEPAEDLTASIEGTAAGSTYPIVVYHARNQYNVVFYDGDQIVDTQAKLYEASLAEFASKTITSPEPARVTFGGWAESPNVTDATAAIDWADETMPAQTKQVYAIWVPVAYHVILDLGNDAATMDPNQSMSFWPPYGVPIDGTYMNNATLVDHTLVGWFDTKGNAWNFANGMTNTLCDTPDSPIYDEEYHNYYYELHLTARWRLSVSIGVKYDLNGGTGNAADFTDNETYTQYGSAKLVDARPTPPSEQKHFVGWVDKLGNLHNPGESVVLGNEALFTTEDDGNLYMVLTAVYNTNVPTTTITYHANYENGPANVVDDKNGVRYDWNEETTLKGADTFSRANYALIGWNSDAAAAARGEVQFALGASVLVSAMNTQINESIPAGNNDLYAVWSGAFYVYYTGSNTVVRVPISEVGAAGYDLTAGVDKSTYLYGGYFNDYRGSAASFNADALTWNADNTAAGNVAAYDGTKCAWGTPYTESGMAMTPVVGTVYYVKEVPAESYLQPYFHYTYYLQDSHISSAWLITNVDDYFLDEYGFLVATESKKGTLVKTLTVKTEHGTSTQTLTSQSVYGVPGYLAYVQVMNKAQLTNGFATNTNVLQYWKTPDGLYVTGTAIRSYTNVETHGSVAAAESSADSKIAASVSALFN